jgi:hypothetical protein
MLRCSGLGITAAGSTNATELAGASGSMAEAVDQPHFRQNRSQRPLSQPRRAT